MYDLTPFIKFAQGIVEESYNNNSAYDCANVVNILYTIGQLPDAGERMTLAKRLIEYIDKNTGIVEVEGHINTHSTAFICGALNLLDEESPVRAKAFEKYLDKEELFAFMDGIDWDENPWLGAHYGAGIYASMILSGTANGEWEDYYFEWLNKNQDAKTGLWTKNCKFKAEEFHYLAAAFHYIFNYEYAKREIPNAEKLLITCIDAYENGKCMDFSADLGWPDIDFTYMLVHLQRRCGKHFEKVNRIVKEIADGLAMQLINLTDEKIKKLKNINTLFAIVCALAVLQDACPGYIKTPTPLKLVLDKRPFL